jgi:hypothetical protein
LQAKPVTNELDQNFNHCTLCSQPFSSLQAL